MIKFLKNIWRANTHPKSLKVYSLFDEETTGPQALAELLIAVSLIWFFVLADGFGLDTVADKVSRDYGGRYLSESYPTDDSDVAVVLLNKDYVKQHGGWPPSFDKYSDLLRRTLGTDPASVTIDIIISNKPSDKLMHGYDEFLRVINQYKKRGVPLYFAYDQKAELADFYDGVNTVAIAWDGHEEYYPYSSQDIITPAFRIYKEMLKIELKNQVENQEIDKPVETFKLYREKLQKELNSNTEIDMAINTTVDELMPKDDLFVVWGKSSNNQCRLSQFSCLQKNPYISTLLAVDLLKKRVSEKAIKKLKGKHVFIGALILGTEDLHKTPIDGAIPGVYFHAMATDNLLKWDNNYYKKQDSFDFGYGELDGGTLVEIIVLIMNIFIFRFAKNITVNISSSPKISFVASNLASLAISLFFLALSFVTIYIGFYLVTEMYHMAPSNIIGLLAVDIVLIFTAEKIFEVIFGITFHLWTKK